MCTWGGGTWLSCTVRLLSSSRTLSMLGWKIFVGSRIRTCNDGHYRTANNSSVKLRFLIEALEWRRDWQLVTHVSLYNVRWFISSAQSSYTWFIFCCSGWSHIDTLTTYTSQINSMATLTTVLALNLSRRIPRTCCCNYQYCSVLIPGVLFTICSYWTTFKTVWCFLKENCFTFHSGPPHGSFLMLTHGVLAPACSLGI